MKKIFGKLLCFFGWHLVERAEIDGSKRLVCWRCCSVWSLDEKSWNSSMNFSREFLKDALVISNHSDSGDPHDDVDFCRRFDELIKKKIDILFDGPRFIEGVCRYCAEVDCECSDKVGEEIYGKWARAFSSEDTCEKIQTEKT